jgi:hypothetical protein
MIDTWFMLAYVNNDELFCILFRSTCKSILRLWLSRYVYYVSSDSMSSAS